MNTVEISNLTEEQTLAVEDMLELWVIAVEGLVDVDFCPQVTVRSGEEKLDNAGG